MSEGRGHEDDVRWCEIMHVDHQRCLVRQSPMRVAHALRLTRGACSEQDHGVVVGSGIDVGHGVGATELVHLGGGGQRECRLDPSEKFIDLACAEPVMKRNSPCPQAPARSIDENGVEAVPRSERDRVASSHAVRAQPARHSGRPLGHVGDASVPVDDEPWRV